MPVCWGAASEATDPPTALSGPLPASTPPEAPTLPHWSFPFSLLLSLGTLP